MQAHKSFKKNFSREAIKELYTTKIIKSSFVGIDRINHVTFQKKLDQNLDIIYKKVHANSYKFSPYKQKLISKGAKKYPRELSIPTIRDGIVLRCLCNLLTDVYQDELNIEIPQMKIEQIKNVIQSDKYDGFVKIDVTSFYPSIDHEILFRILRYKVRKDEVIDLLKNSIINPTIDQPRGGKYKQNKLGVPQGLSISNILAEIYLKDLDELFSSIGDIKYFRYVDDILILCNEIESQDIGKFVIRKLQELRRLTGHEFGTEGKTEFGKITQGFTYLGYSFVDKVITVKSNSVRKFEGSIAKAITAYKYASQKDIYINPKGLLEWRLNLKITGCIFEGKKLGWLFYFSQMNDLNLLYKIDNTIKKILTRVGIKDDVSPKKLSKAYHECKRKKSIEHKYITNFDVLDITEKRMILQNYIIGSRYRIDSKTDEEIEELFGKRIRTIVNELEQDISNIY